MTAPKSVDPAVFLREQLALACPDLLRKMVKTFADALMSAEADAACGAPYGERSEERTNSRNGYRNREWDTRAGTVQLAIPKLRTGSYYPDWLLQHPRRAEQALVSVVATATCWGCRPGGWRSSSSSWVCPSCPSRRFLRWPAISTPRSRRSATGRWMRVRTRSCGSTR